MLTIEIITNVIIPAVGALLVYFLIPYIKERTTKEQRDNMCFWVKVAVNSAEMIFAEKGQGKLKKEYVLEFLNNRGFNITAHELDVLIEAAVKELNIVMGK